MPAPAFHRTLSSAIVERLRQGILAGRYPAGTQLRQDALAAEFAVSRIPVREALFQLVAEGLVRIEPHKGAVVAGFELAEIDDVFDLRVLLEPRLLARSAPRLQAADYEDIEALDAAFEEAVGRRDVARWGELNEQLHLSLYRHAALPRTMAIVGALLQSSDRYTRVQMNREATLARAMREHHRLIALCRSGRTAQACEYLAAHIEAVRRDLRRLLRLTRATTATARAQPGAAVRPERKVTLSSDAGPGSGRPRPQTAGRRRGPPRQAGEPR
ncbi:MAG: GntR family transcriptional regulator [Rubrivivax sp.]|nr:GntR family transcriptional regulator [Rubrivivax sp.]